MTSTISAQITTLIDSLRATESLIIQLSTLSFTPGSETDSTSVRVELTQDIQENLKQLEEDLELLRQEAEDLLPSSTTSSSGVPGGSFRAGRRESSGSTSGSETESRRIQAQISRISEDLNTTRGKFRRAQLTAKKSSELARLKEREAIFASISNPTPPPSDPTTPTAPTTNPRDRLFGNRTKQKPAHQTEVDASSAVTSSLRRTHALLSTELSRSRFAQETFDQSTAALAELGEKYNSLDTVLKSSKELLGTLLRSQKSDTWYLETAFYILLCTLVWLVFRRILLGPFVRLPLFLLKLVWRPLVGLAYLTGVVTKETVSPSVASVRSTVRTPLIVQPSAAGQGDIPRFDPEMAEQIRQKGGVPVGAGGEGAKTGEQPERVLDGEESEKIGRMAEEAKRGDGTMLKERAEEHGPPNRKKKMFEAEVEDQRHAQQEEGDDRARDEL